LPFDDAIANINAIIDVFQAENPNVIIIIDQSAPTRLENTGLLSGLTMLHQEVLQIANEQSTNTSRVIPVDMFRGFIPDQMLADNVHYNEIGAAFIASRYFEILENIFK